LKAAWVKLSKNCNRLTIRRPAVERVFFCLEKSDAVTEKDSDILARTLWGEARGESLAGQIAVAWTIRNRVSDGNARSWWGEGYASVCLAPYQFRCWNKNDPNYQYLSGAKALPFRELAQAWIAADQVIDGKIAEPAGGAMHHHATSINAPAWTAKAKQTLKLGGHVFFQRCAVTVR